jgi:hypothetical protein
MRAIQRARSRRRYRFFAVNSCSAIFSAIAFAGAESSFVKMMIDARFSGMRTNALRDLSAIPNAL